MWGGRGGHCGHPGLARAVHPRNPSLRACIYPRLPLRAYRRCWSCARALLLPTPERAPCVERFCAPTRLYPIPRLAGLRCDPISATCLGPFPPPSAAVCPSPFSAIETSCLAMVTDLARPPSRLHRPLLELNLALSLGVRACVTRAQSPPPPLLAAETTHLSRSEYWPWRARREPAKILAPPSSTGCCASIAQRWQAPPQQRPRQRRGHPRRLRVRTGGTRRGACCAPAPVAVHTERETAAAGQHRRDSSANETATCSSFETLLASAPHLQCRRLPARASGLDVPVLSSRPPHLQCDARGTRVVQRVV